MGVENLGGSNTVLGGDLSAFVGQWVPLCAILHCISDWRTPDYDPPQVPEPTSPGSQKMVYFPHVLPAILTDFWPKTG